MNTNHKIESTLTGKFSDIIDFLTAQGADEADQLARRAVGVIISTDRPQTGEESDTDPFVANMLASAALVSISENLKHYPFVSNSADFDQSALLNPGGLDVIESARELVERAETLLGMQPELPARQASISGLDTVPAALVAVVDDVICRLFEETGQLPAAVFVVVVDDGALLAAATGGDADTTDARADVEPVATSAVAG